MQEDLPSWLLLLLRAPLSLPRGLGANESGDTSSILQEARLAPCTSQEQLLPAVSQMLAMGHQDGIGKRMWIG